MKARRAHKLLPQVKNTRSSSFASFIKASDRVASCADPSIVTLRFKKADSAQLFFKFLVERLPLLNTEYPKFEEGKVTLSSEQFLYCERQAMCESGQLSTEYLADCLLKTLRADEFDFSYQFILGIIPGENNSRRLHNLRPTQRRPFLIAPDGTVKAREHKESMYSREEKVGFSQAQSNTLLDPDALSKAFGFNRGHRNDKLYGIVTHSGDALFNRLLTNDSGTVTRIFEFSNTVSAENGLSSLKGCLYTTDQLEEFKIANKNSRLSSSRTNEVLARIRFNPHRSAVCICSDTLEARLLAYDFSQELLEHYRIYAEKQGFIVNPDFKIPIIFYIQKNNSTGFFPCVHHDIRHYTDQMRKQDEAEALKIYQNKDKRNKHYRNKDFEFLLGLPEITHEMLLDTCLGEPLAYVMLKNGYTRMLMRLLKNPTLRDRVFSTLINQHLVLFKTNDPIIASLVLAEQFDLADKLIDATRSQKDKVQMVRSEHRDLFNYLLHKGNPRQIQYMGLDDILLRAAGEHLWVTVKLCLKELPNIKSSTLRSLFSRALSYKKSLELKFLFQISDEFDGMIIELFNVAIDRRDWEQVVSMMSSPAISANKPLLVRVSTEVIKNYQVRVARLLVEKGVLLSEEVDAIIIQLFNAAIDQHDWQQVVSLISNPVIFESRALVARAFNESTKSKRFEIARLLIEKGVLLPEEVDAIIVKLFNATIDQRDWEYMLLLTSNPVIFANKSLLGRALIKALECKQVNTARLLIEKGALPEKYNDHTRFIEGVLYHVLNSQLFELIPEAIEVESKYTDDAVQIRYHVALHLANELRNSSAISCLEGIRDKFDIFDPKCIKIAILYLVLTALSDNKLELAEIRLIGLCHQYQLLPADNHSINDALDVVMEHFYDAATSTRLSNPWHVFSYLVKLYLSEKNIHKLVSLLTSHDYANFHVDVFYRCVQTHIYQNLIKSLSSQNIGIIRFFKHGYIDNESDLKMKSSRNYQWHTHLTRHFEATIQSKDYTEEEIVLLFDLGVVLTDDKWVWAFELLLMKGYLKASDRLLTHAKIKEGYLDKCIKILITYPNYIQALAPSLLNKIKAKHIGLISIQTSYVQKDSVITFLTLVKDGLTDNQADFWDFYLAFVFHPFTETLEIEKELMRLLEPSTIRHMLLIFVVDRFQGYLKPLEDNVLHEVATNWPDLTKALLKRRLLLDYSIYEVNETLDLQEREILSILNHYFSDIDVIPPKEIIDATYAKVLELFELSSNSNKQDINTNFLTYMKNLDQELSKTHRSSCQQEVSLPCPDQNIDSNFDDYEVCYLY